MGKLLLVACTNVGRYIIEELMNNKDIGAELVGVVNLNQTKACSKANYDSYADLAIKYGFPIYYCNNINDDETISFMEGLSPDIILQSGWSQKFSDKVLNLPKFGCIGEHPAPLPKGRGAACVNWAILTGETQWGDTYFKMVSEYDKGEIYAQRFFEIKEYDNVFTVYEKVARCAADVVAEWAERWTKGCFDVVKQDDAKATYYKKRCPTDGEIKSFSDDAKIIHDFIRAQTTPYPGAYLETKKGKLYLLLSEVCESCTTQENPGTILNCTSKGGMLVTCGNGTVLEIKRVKFENNPSMWAADLCEGIKLPLSIFDI